MTSHIDLIDMNFVRMAQDHARRMGCGTAEMNFAALSARLAAIRSEMDLPPAEKSVAVIARDFDNRAQDMLAKAVGAHFTVWEVDYRHAYVTSPADEQEKMPQSLSHWLAYMCGLVASSTGRSVVAVSTAFELAGPLSDFATRNSGGRAVLAFFQRFLNKRWKDTGLLDNRLPIEFANLDRHSIDLLGVDLRDQARRNAAAQRGTSLPL
jgi:hypothetical protein